MGLLSMLVTILVASALGSSGDAPTLSPRPFEADPDSV